jgi:hypothetical protein
MRKTHRRLHGGQDVLCSMLGLFRKSAEFLRKIKLSKFWSFHCALRSFQQETKTSEEVDLGPMTKIVSNSLKSLAGGIESAFEPGGL